MNVSTKVKKAKSTGFVVTKYIKELLKDVDVTILKSIIREHQLLQHIIHIESFEKNLHENRIQRQVSDFKATQR
jgi:hypothetical protein